MRNKTTRSILMTLLAVLIVLATPFSPATAQTKEQLQAKFEKRYPQLLSYKQQGRVGENMEGYVEAVKKEYLDDKTLSKLIDDENADRKQLYGLIAADEKTTPDKVAVAAAKRNYEKAKSGEYLKGNDGQWHKKG
jgi:uncharacterized protein YdbL (DUF1318 family)